MTEAEYIENVRARFPKCFTESGLAIPAALAKRENAARLRVIGHTPQKVPNPNGTTTRSPETEARRIARLQDKMAARKVETRARIWNALAAPKTVNDLAHECCLSRHAIHTHLTEMTEQGKVTRTFVRRVAIWERQMEAAE